ncbi:hypothetical protein SATRM34S_00836 [Streptomyces atroolivaceus]
MRTGGAVRQRVLRDPAVPVRPAGPSDCDLGEPDHSVPADGDPHRCGALGGQVVDRNPAASVPTWPTRPMASARFMVNHMASRPAAITEGNTPERGSGTP